jgi:hypothetical protein
LRLILNKASSFFENRKNYRVSTACAMRKSNASCKCGVMICKPMGNPDTGNGTEIAGNPARFTGMVQTSAR